MAGIKKAAACKMIVKILMAKYSNVNKTRLLNYHYYSGRNPDRSC